MCGLPQVEYSVTDDDVYPMPRVEELLDQMGKAKFVMTLKTAFVTSEGKFRFTRIPFGLKGAPTTFQDTLLARNRDHASSYVDDTVVFSNTWTEHLSQRCLGSSEMPD